MQKIWSPVILAQLNPDHALAIEQNYQLEKDYQSIEDLKVKVDHLEATNYGKYVECMIRFQVLALLQQFEHKPDLVRYQDEIKEWLPANCFDPPMEFKMETDMIAKIEKVACEGELQDDTLRVQAQVDYTILATQNQAVTLAAAPEREPLPPPLPIHTSQAILDTIHNLECEVRRLSQDNTTLSHRLMLYEKNLLNLKNALQKAEGRSHSLLNELSQSARVIQALKGQVRDREIVIRQESLRNPCDTYINSKGPRMGFTDRIRQLFANS